MTQDKAVGGGEPSAPESFYVQQPPQQLQQPQQAPQDHANEKPQPGYQIPAYNPGAAEYADHQSYAYPPPPTRPQDAGESAPSTAAPSGHHSGLSHRLSALGTMVASPINMLANKMGSEGFLPATMDKECEKAARVLKGFCSKF